MKRMTNFFLALSMMLFLFAISPIVKAESNSEWKIWAPKTEVDIDKVWTIKFNDEVDWQSYGSIYVVRERDNVPMFVDSTTHNNDKKSLVLPLGFLYDFNETYYLYIKDVKSIHGSTLREPIKMKFQTINPDFNVAQMVEKDGIRFNVMLSETDTKLYAKLKATNVSENTISYIGYDGCDRGLKANLFNKTDSGEVKVGSKWRTSSACTAAIEEYVLEPGETIEVIEVLYLPKEPVDGGMYLKVGLETGSYSDEAPLTPTEIEIPVK